MRPTASGAALLHACGYPFRDDVKLPPSPPSREATRGTIFGLLVEARINGTPDAPGIPEMLATLDPDEARRVHVMWAHASKWLDERKRLGWCAERAFAYDPATDVGRELPRTEHRDYDTHATSSEVCATLDITSLEEDVVVVRDWKTKAPGAPEVDAREQLEWCALFAARAWGYDSARIETLVVTEAGISVENVIHLDMFDLAAIGERIKADVARIPGAEPVDGDHCRERYCKAIAVCPKTTEALAPALLPVEALTKRWAYSPVIQSPDHLQALMQMHSLVKKVASQVTAAIAAYVADGDVTTTDGSRIYQSYRTMSRLNQAELAATVKRLGGTQDDIDACVHPAREGNGVKVQKPEKAKRGKAA